MRLRLVTGQLNNLIETSLYAKDKSDDKNRLSTPEFEDYLGEILHTLVQLAASKNLKLESIAEKRLNKMEELVSLKQPELALDSEEF